MMLLGGGRLICGHLRLLLLLLLPGGGLLWRLLVGARGLLRGPVARLLLVGLRVLLVAWVLRLLAGVGIILLILGIWVPASLLLLRGQLLRGQLLVHLLIWLLCKASRRLLALVQLRVATPGLLLLRCLLLLLPL